jgi:hypothetical protein
MRLSVPAMSMNQRLADLPTKDNTLMMQYGSTSLQTAVGASASKRRAGITNLPSPSSYPYSSKCLEERLSGKSE